MPQPFKPAAPKPFAAVCGDRLAVNLADLDRINPFIRQAMDLARKLDATAPVYVDPDRWDKTAVAFTCDLLTAACLLDVIRDYDRKAGAYVTRAYINRGGGWVKLAAGAVLTAGGGARLNPAVFSVAAVHDAALPPVEKVF